MLVWFLSALASDWFGRRLSILPILVAVPIWAFMFRWLYRRISSHRLEYQNYQAGREGEDSVVERMQEKLDDNWTIFRNLVLPGAHGDADIVLVGPSEVWLIEVKAHKGNFRLNGGVLER